MFSMCAGGRRHYYEAYKRCGGSDVYIEKNWSQMSSSTYDASPFKVDTSYLGRWGWGQTGRRDSVIRHTPWANMPPVRINSFPKVHTNYRLCKVRRGSQRGLGNGGCVGRFTGI